MTQLKTFQDLKEGCGRCDGSCHRCQGGTRTDEELDKARIFCIEPKVDYEKARVEAIKWIKENYGSENMLQLYDKDESTQSGDHKFSQMVAIRNWIKHFFNIEDDELK
mgnify:FL=1